MPPLIAKAYETEVRADLKSIQNGMAQQAAFDAFFQDSGLKNDYDRHALKMSEEQIERVKNGERANTLQDKKRGSNQPPLFSVDHLREFGEVAEGMNYLIGLDLTAPFYTGNISPANQRVLDRLEKQANSEMLRKPLFAPLN